MTKRPRTYGTLQPVEWYCSECGRMTCREHVTAAGRTVKSVRLQCGCHPYQAKGGKQS